MEIFIINLEKRKDRWENINKKFNGLNLVRINAIEDNTNGAIGCFKSHQKCINIAKEKELNKILVFEDDCEIIGLNITEFIQLLEKLDKYLNDLEDWNVLYGAGNKLKYENIIEKKESIIIPDINKYYDLYLVNFLKTAHWVWYNNKVYDWFLNQNPYSGIPIDRIWHGKFNCLVILPFIATQSSDYSDIEKKNCSYAKSLKKYEKNLIDNINKKK